MHNIGLDDYRNSIGGSQEALELIKAMQAGSITGRDTTNLPLTGEPLKAEALDKVLKSLEYRTTDIKLLNLIPKDMTYNTVAEYLQMVSYGNINAGFAYPEGALSNVNDSTYERRAAYIKFYQTTGEVTMQAQATKSFFDIYQKEVENKAMLLSRVINTQLTHGDSNCVPLEFDSLYKLHASVGSGAGQLYSTFEQYYNSGVVVDMRGKSVKQSNIEDGTVVVDANYGTSRQFCSTTSIISTISKDYYNVQRIMLGGGFAGDSNSVIKKITTTIADVDLISDKFMARNPGKTSATPADTPQAPAAPTVSAVALVADANAKFATTDPGGFNHVFYAVSGKNAFGESPLAIFATSVVTAAGYSVDITATAGAGAYPATGYVIYRTKPTAATVATGLTFYPIFQVSQNDFTVGFNGGAAGNVRDCGYFLPDCEEGLLIDFEPDVCTLYQLLPMSKIDLAVLSLSRRFITFQWCAPALFTAKKCVKFINCSKVYAA